MNELNPIPGPMPNTSEWQAVHRKLMTASRAGAICGKSDYATPLDIFLEATGRKPPMEDNAYTRRGRRYERAILSDYQERMGVELITEQRFYFHPDISFIGVTPDAMIQGIAAGVEAKLTMSPKRAAELGEEGTDFIPDDWMLQGQAQNDTMNWQYVDFAVLVYGRLKTYHVVRNDDLIDLWHDAATELWERIQNDDPPEPNWEHPRALELMKSLYDLKSGTSILLSPEAELTWSVYESLKEEQKKLKRMEDAAKAKILGAIGDAEIGILPDGTKLIRKEVPRKEYTVDATSYIQLRKLKGKK